MRYNLGMATHNSVRISHNKTKKKAGGWFSYKIKHVASSNLLHKQTDTNQKHCLWSCNQWTTVLTNAGRGSQTTCVCWWHTLIPTGCLFCGRNWTPSRTGQPVFTQAVSSSVYMLLPPGIWASPSLRCWPSFSNRSFQQLIGHIRAHPTPQQVPAID